MAKTNAAQGGINLILKEYKTLKRAAKEFNPVHLGMERVSSSQAANRFREMSPEQKQGMIDQIGIKEVMKIVRSGK